MERTELVYKTVDSTELLLHVFWPENRQTGTSHPAIVFFFGGGWVMVKRRNDAPSM